MSVRDFVAAGEGELPMGPAQDEWSMEIYGFADAEYVSDDTFVTQGLSHLYGAADYASLLAEWQVFVHASSQSQSFPVLPGGLYRYRA